MWLPTAAEMARLDEHATRSGAIPERALIENAGRAVARHLQARFPSGRVLALAGSGHNGADALVAGRTLGAWGRDVVFLRCGSRLPEPDVLRGWSLEVGEPDRLDTELARAEVVVDGILGTGLDTAPREPQASMIERANASDRPIVAVDGPSGVDFTTGAVPGAAIRAALTVTLGWPKLGLLRFPARARCGDLVSVEIGFPPPAPPPAARAITARWAGALWPRRSAAAHKGEAGYLAIVGGREGMAGAVVLAARSALRSGAGIVRVVSEPGNREILQSAVPSAVFVGWDDEGEVAEAVRWAHAVAVGPGLGTGPGRRELVAGVLAGRSGPAVLDADGLNVWSADLEALAGMSGGGLLLTPHPGEMARLLDEEVSTVTGDPAPAALRLAREAGGVAVLKGAPTWVASPDGSLRVTTLLSPVFGSGGMGDVLTGVCGAALAAGLGAADAATAALGATGVAALLSHAEEGTSSADLPEWLPPARREMTEGPWPLWPGVHLAVPAVREP